MKKMILRALRRVTFVAAVLGTIVWLGFVMQPQDTPYADMPTTITFDDFYQMTPNTVDVLFMGSSHGVCAFNPVELYNEYGLRSYNLSSIEQSLPITYFWLQEALRTQHPEVVMLDTFFLFDYSGQYDAPMNMPETSVRKSFDPMKFSTVKLKALWETYQIDKEYEPLSFLFPIIRYHSRWQDLNAESFFPADQQGLMGYRPSFSMKVQDFSFEPFERLYEDQLEMKPVMRQYLEKVVELCRQEDIRLVLVKTPTRDHLLEKHNAVREFADEYGLDFIDFNESAVFYDGLDYWFETDNSDYEHANYYGSVKVMSYLGNYLVEECGLEPHEDEQWSGLDELYQQRLIEAEEAAMNAE